MSTTQTGHKNLNELDENFNPKEQKKDNAQAVLPRAVIKQFANRRSDLEGLKQLIFHVSCILVSQYTVYSTCPQSTHNDFLHFLLSIVHLAANILCGYTMSFLFMGLHECVVCQPVSCVSNKFPTANTSSTTLHSKLRCSTN